MAEKGQVGLNFGPTINQTNLGKVKAKTKIKLKRSNEPKIGSLPPTTTILYFDGSADISTASYCNYDTDPQKQDASLGKVHRLT